MNVVIRGLPAVMPLKGKWASLSPCLGRYRLTLSTDLLQLPKSLGEYIIVAELAQILAKKGTSLYTSFMSAYLPDWQKRQQQLGSEYEAKVKPIKKAAKAKKL